MSVCTIPAMKVADIDLLDRARDKLRTVHVALSPEADGWRDEQALLSIWAVVESVMGDLNHLRDGLCDGVNS